MQINLRPSLLSFVALIALSQASAGSTELTSGSSIAANYWVPIKPPKAHYTIDCSIDLTKGLLEGTEVIRFKNTTSRAIRRLNVKWTSLGSMEITSKDKVVKILAETKEGAESYTVIELPEPIGPNEKTTLQIKYRVLAPDYLKGEEIRVPSFCPQLWWGYSTHNSFEVKIDIPPEYTLAISGVFDTKTGYYHAENVSRFGLFLGKGNKVIKANAEDVLVQVVFKPEAEKCAHLILDTAVDVINFYRQRFGFYPYQSLSIVPGGMDRPAGGYPIATSLVGIHAMEQMDTMPEVHWRWITAHEIGHQYWGEYVLSNDPSASFDWLMIGLGIYADREYTQARNLGTAKHQGLMNRYIKGVRAGLDTTINRTPEERSKIQFDFNNVVEHGKSYSVISALDCVLGKKVFDRIYKRCLKEFGGKRLGVHEFQAVCEEESGQDLGWFFEQWVNSNKYLSYEISSKKCEKKGNQYVSEVEVKCLGDLKTPVPVEAYFKDGTSQTRFTDRLLDINVLKFESKSPLKEVKIDPDGKLALVVPPPPSLVEKGLVRKMRGVPLVGAGKEALNMFERVKESRVSDADAWFSLGLALYDGKYYTEALEAFSRSQGAAAKNSMDDFVALVWQGHILDIFGRRKEALDKYKEALKKAKYFEMRHDQYGIKVNRQWVEERIRKPFER